MLNKDIERKTYLYARTSRVGFELFSYLFQKYGCEIISVLHCYTKKLYSSKKAKKIKEILEDDS